MEAGEVGLFEDGRTILIEYSLDCFDFGLTSRIPWMIHFAVALEAVEAANLPDDGERRTVCFVLLVLALAAPARHCQ